MTEDEFFERFDRHLVESKALMREIKAETALTRAEVQRSREAHEDLRAFTREITTRNQKVWREVMDGLADMRTEIRAQTRGLLRVLERLEGTT